MRSFTLLFLVLLTLNSCKKNDEEGASTCTPLNLNLFSLQQDIELGAQVAAEIENDPATYPILSESTYPEAYGHIRRITTKILNSGNVKHQGDFAWQVKIIRDDNTLNAFCTPGGYIYVYTGLIKYLDAEDDLAGVMGHEIAHADQRHTTETMTREYGINTLLQIVLGNDPSTLVTLAKNLTDLKYSRCHESEADDYSVRYLANTTYRCNGAASFFEKIQAAGGSSVPEFLSTHPDPGNRVQNINAVADSKSCNKTIPASDEDYAAFKASLP
ncbi:MAG: Peptidase family [Cytophagaceae bacterium]|jgi:predicted Zn-dependent protease|nr:Peptidase family [Cytophagaceae bacterium]